MLCFFAAALTQLAAKTDARDVFPSFFDSAFALFLHGLLMDNLTDFLVGLKEADL